MMYPSSQSTARVPGMLAALKIMMVPYYCLMLIQPQAVLLCWGTFAASHHALQVAFASSLWSGRLPRALLPPDQRAVAGEAGGAASTGQAAAAAGLSAADADLLLFLGRRYAKQRRKDAALSCFQIALRVTEGESTEAEKEIKALRLDVGSRT